jgi:putative transposase
LLGLSRSSFYYRPAKDSPLNLELMHRIDQIYTRWPFYGVPRITAVLRKQGFEINHKRIERLMKKMGIQAIYPKKNLSRSDKEHRIYPYLLRHLDISRPDQVWAADITYIRLLNGFLYLVAIIDWYSRYVLGWRLSNSLDNRFCVELLEETLREHQPEIFNTDQGVQFTSDDFISVLKKKEIRISMDGRGRALDNIMIERLWRSVKYEEVYLKDYRNGRDAFKGLKNYFAFYNNERLHQSLGYQTPMCIRNGGGHA